jgi:hypothetical protein
MLTSLRHGGLVFRAAGVPGRAEADGRVGKTAEEAAASPG